VHHLPYNLSMGFCVETIAQSVDIQDLFWQGSTSPPYPLSLGAVYVLKSVLFSCQGCRDCCPLVLSGSVSCITSTWIAGENLDNPGTSSLSPVVLWTLQTAPSPTTQHVGFEPRIAHPVASHCTDYAIPVLTWGKINFKIGCRWGVGIGGRK